MSVFCLKITNTISLDLKSSSEIEFLSTAKSGVVNHLAGASICLLYLFFHKISETILGVVCHEKLWSLQT